MTVFLSVRKTRKEPNIDRHHETNLSCEDQFTVYLFVCFFVLRTQFNQGWCDYRFLVHHESADSLEYSAFENVFQLHVFG